MREDSIMDGSSLLHHISEKLDRNRLENANLAKLQFVNSNLTSSEFEKSNLTNAFIRHSILQNVTIDECSFSECKISKINKNITPGRSFFKECNLSKIKLNDCNLSHSSFIGCDWTGALINDIPVDIVLKAYKNRKKMMLLFAGIYVLTLLGIGALYLFLKH